MNNPPLAEPIADTTGFVRRAWSLWFGQVFRGSGFLGSGDTRPNLRSLFPGQYFFDTTLGSDGKPVFVNGDASGWVLADGTAA